MTRRTFATLLGSAVASALTGCARGTATPAQGARLTARPGGTAPTAPAGTTPLGLDATRDGVLRIPSRGSAPWPLLVLLHGAGGSGMGQLRRLEAAIEEAGIAVLAPDARGSTWDAIRDRFGRDVNFLDRALARTFATVAVDPARVAIGGFSDGATYALSLGLQNGDLFQRIVAFSPGFIVEGSPQGRPRCFLSHGTADQILPIDRCSRMIVPALRQRGYDVTYREFEGGHLVPPAVAAEGLRWMSAATSS